MAVKACYLTACFLFRLVQTVLIFFCDSFAIIKANQLVHGIDSDELLFVNDAEI